MLFNAVVMIFTILIFLKIVSIMQSVHCHIQGAVSIRYTGALISYWTFFLYLFCKDPSFLMTKPSYMIKYIKMVFSMPLQQNVLSN